ncbi:MAG: peptidase M13, partial [Verrucomicrobia bacterium]|nr:peptidase M13 [Verrucomicrobiota bacterium]
MQNASRAITRCLSSFTRVALGITLLSTAALGAEKPAIDFSGFDKTVRPQDNFFDFVNGQWIKDTPIPADKTRWGSFVILAEESRDAVQAIIDELSQSTNLAAGSDSQKIRDLYRSYLDEDRINELGLSPIAEELEKIANTPLTEFAKEWATAGREGISRPFSFWIDQDSKNSTSYAIYFTQSGLGLPDRDYYFEEDERSKSIQNHYQILLTKLFTLAGIDQAASKAYKVYELEKAIAEHHWTRVENRDRIKTYNKVSIAELRTLLPNFQWNDYLGISDIAQEKHVIVRQPSFLKGLQKVLADTKEGDWKAYYQARLLIDAAPYLSDEFFQASFDFFSKKLGGQEEPEPRPRRAVSLVNGILGEVVGKEYVKRHFPPTAKSRMLDLVGNLRKAMAESIDGLTWMDDATKAEAHKKLAKFTTKIGYPDKWKDYSSLEITSDDLIGNLRRASEFVHAREVAKLGKPIDRTEWFMNPQTVNAYY